MSLVVDGDRSMEIEAVQDGFVMKTYTKGDIAPLHWRFSVCKYDAEQLAETALRFFRFVPNDCVAHVEIKKVAKTE